MTQEALKLAFEKMTGVVGAWEMPALMQSRNGFIQGWEAAIDQAQKQEPVAWPHKYGCRANAFGKCDMGCTTPPQLQPMTLEKLREHWEGAKVLDMTDAEISFSDYVLIVKDVEALYGIKGEA